MNLCEFYVNLHYTFRHFREFINPLASFSFVRKRQNSKKGFRYSSSKRWYTFSQLAFSVRSGVCLGKRHNLTSSKKARRKNKKPKHRQAQLEDWPPLPTQLFRFTFLLAPDICTPSFSCNTEFSSLKSVF